MIMEVPEAGQPDGHDHGGSAGLGADGGAEFDRGVNGC